MKLYVLSAHSTKRGSICPAPEVFTDIARATRRFWEYCGGNMSINPDGETVHEHWKTKTISRCDVFDVPENDPAPMRPAAQAIAGEALAATPPTSLGLETYYGFSPAARASYTVGSVIEYTVGSATRRVRVTHCLPDIKNGLPGFLGEWLNVDAGMQPGAGTWGYDAQIVRVLT